MEKTYRPQKTEDKIYRLWEKGGYFTPKINPQKKPFTILLPLPNANDPLHMGHALFTIQDLLIRYQRMLDRPALWLPGGDHAGIETQFVFEKKLGKEGKSRFDFDRETLYQMIAKFVEKNKDINKKQLKKLGFSLDWTRYHYSLEPGIQKIVFETFQKLHQDGLVYRGERIVNFCPQCGTAFSNLEIRYKEEKDSLYFLDYGSVQISTTRPETIFADVGVAVNPQDKRYQKLIGQKATVPLINKKVPIIGDKQVEAKFGTGALKITPGHDPVDFEIGQKHHLKLIKVIDRHGKMINLPNKYRGLRVDKARNAVLADLKKEGKLIKTKSLVHSVGFCYRCGTTIEPLTMPQWFIKMKPLAKPAIEAVKKGQTKVVPKKRFEKMYFDWLEGIQDWNISRQIVWGPRIPAWYCLECNPKISLDFINKKGKRVSGKYQDLKEKYPFLEIKKGLQSLTAPLEAIYFLKKGSCPKCNSRETLQETDTFDTWFLSCQWPLTTLGYPDKKDFQYFYPTSVLDTLWDILFFWVARMMIFGLYLTKEVPFKVIHLHARVVDKQGQKMSKSKGNVINPMEMIEVYGADPLRMALIIGVSPGSDIALSDNKVRAMGNFANKTWNIGRFILKNLESSNKKVPFYTPKMEAKLTKEDKEILKDLNQLVKKTTRHLEAYRFDLAADHLYHFLWHRFADEYLESSKARIKEEDIMVLAILRHVYLNCLKLLHPFMPFITEEIWQKFPKKSDQPLIVSQWPK